MSQKNQPSFLTSVRNFVRGRQALRQAARRAVIDTCESRLMYDGSNLPSYSVTGTSKSDTIIVDVQHAANGKYNLTSTVNGVKTVRSNLSPSSLNIYGLSGHDLIIVNGAFDSHALNVYGDDGNDKLVLKAPSNASLYYQFYEGMTYSGGAGSDIFVLDSSARPDQAGISTTYTLGDRDIQVSEKDAIPLKFKWESVESQEIRTGGGYSRINVQRTLIPTQIVGGVGTDEVVIGLNGLMDAVQGPVTISGGSGKADTLVFDDTGRTSYMRYDFDLGSMDLPTAPPVKFAGMDKVHLRGGEGGSEVYIKAVATGTHMQVNGNGGADTFILSAGDMDTINAVSLKLYGESGDDKVILNDAADTMNRNYILSNTKLKRSGSLETQIGGINQVVLNGSKGSNLVEATMSNATGFDLRGNSPGFGTNADRLNVYPTAEKPKLQMTAVGAGKYSIPGKQSVIFSGFEQFTDSDKAGAAIVGSVYNDKNANGIRDAGESNIQGRTVFIDDDHDNYMDVNERRTTTDQYGNYQFVGLAAATYSLRQVLADGFRQTSPGAGDSMYLNLSGNQIVTDRLFGTTNTGNITGRVFVDKDKDGKLDSNEYGQAGWRVFIDADGDGKFDANEKSVLTSINGNYTLDALTGVTTYRVRVAPPSGYKPLNAAAASKFAYVPKGGTSSGINFSVVKIA